MEMLADVFGYDKFLEITSEHAIKGTYCDPALKLEVIDDESALDARKRLARRSAKAAAKTSKSVEVATVTPMESDSAENTPDDTSASEDAVAG